MDKRTAFLLPLIALLFFSATCAPPQPRTQLHFGIHAAQKDLWDEAIFRWKKVLETEPNSSAAHNNLAVAYEKKGLWEEARKEYETALELSPGNEYIQANYDRFKRRLEGSTQDETEEKKEKKDEKKK